MTEPANTLPVEPPSEETIFKLLARVGLSLGIPVERATILSRADSADAVPSDPLSGFVVSAEQSGVFVKEACFDDVDEAIGFVQEGYPIIVANPDGSFIVIDSIAGRQIETMTIGEHVTQQALSKRKLQELVFDHGTKRMFLAKKELECDSLSVTPHYSDDDVHPQKTISPEQRFLALLDLERRDIW
ncbi:MAG: hypothetical protein HKN47_02770, partial [Pirellulaceae bacterium]|nr:hypothetical protein [Pirellulaceae bacterium]